MPSFFFSAPAKAAQGVQLQAGSATISSILAPSARLKHGNKQRLLRALVGLA